MTSDPQTELELGENIANELSACIHHWIIKEATGPISEGVCQKCGEVKDHKNSIDDSSPWKDAKGATVGFQTRRLSDEEEDEEEEDDYE